MELGRLCRAKKVPTVVPRGAEYGAVHAALRTLRMTSVCTESAHNGGQNDPEDRRRKSRRYWDLRHQFAAICIGLHRVPEVGLEPTQPCGHWILNTDRESPKPQGVKGFRRYPSAEVPTVVP